MVTLVVYLKFTKTYEGKPLTHSGNHTYREPSLDCCRLSLEIEEEEMKQAGWALQEKHTVKIHYGG